jgi:hypothetical protein
MSNLYPNRWRQDPQPVSRIGELALLACAALLLAAALAALVGLGAAAALFGGGWVWPHGTETAVHVLGGLLTGHPGRGLPPRLAARLPGPGEVYACVGMSELGCVALLVACGVLVARYRQPGDARGGMATRSQAAQVLGGARLRAVAPIIRPDLHTKRRRRGADGGRVA